MQLLRNGAIVCALSGIFIASNQGQETCSKLTSSIARSVLDPEKAHFVTKQYLKYWPVLNILKPRKYKTLNTTVFGLEFTNPIGLAAGFDKNCECLDAYSRLGFGFAEIGSVTPKPQPGNEMPRIFRLTEDLAVINRMGFNNDGFHRVLERMKNYRRSDHDKLIFGINIGMNRDSDDRINDYIVGIKTFRAYVDYITINVSSPNTPGLNLLQEKENLIDLLKLARAEVDDLKASTKPILLLKLSPDLSPKQCSDIADIISRPQCFVDGVILTNTTVERPTELKSEYKSEKGGLSGAPLKERSTEMIRTFYTLTKGKVPIIGVGGISNGQDAYDKISNGASLVQIYTSLVYDGLAKANQISRELDTILKQKGFSNVSEAVGVALRSKS